MKVFLSWAGDDSKYIAETLRDWLPQVIQALEPWMSTHIEKGEAWDGAIAEGLSDSPVGILCLTKDSINSNYLHYEAGAIANVPKSKVCTFLYGLKNADVKQPLGRFQHTSFEKDEVLKLLETINSKVQETGEKPLTSAQLAKSLEVNWPELETKLLATPKSKIAKVERPDRELLEEILERIRSNDSNIKNIDLKSYNDHNEFKRRPFPISTTTQWLDLYCTLASIQPEQLTYTKQLVEYLAKMTNTVYAEDYLNTIIDKFKSNAKANK